MSANVSNLHWDPRQVLWTELAPNVVPEVAKIHARLMDHDLLAISSIYATYIVLEKKLKPETKFEDTPVIL